MDQLIHKITGWYFIVFHWATQVSLSWSDSAVRRKPQHTCDVGLKWHSRPWGGMQGPPQQDIMMTLGSFKMAREMFASGSITMFQQSPCTQGAIPLSLFMMLLSFKFPHRCCGQIPFCSESRTAGKVDHHIRSQVEEIDGGGTLHESSLLPFFILLL